MDQLSINTIRTLAIDAHPESEVRCLRRRLLIGGAI
jgi:hypothetical protein